MFCWFYQHFAFIFQRNTANFELTVGNSSANIRPTNRNYQERSHINMKRFAAFFYGYFYFFGFWAKQVKVFFAANNWLPSAV